MKSGRNLLLFQLHPALFIESDNLLFKSWEEMFEGDFVGMCATKCLLMRMGMTSDPANLCQHGKHGH